MNTNESYDPVKAFKTYAKIDPNQEESIIKFYDLLCIARDIANSILINPTNEDVIKVYKELKKYLDYKGEL